MYTIQFYCSPVTRSQLVGDFRYLPYLFLLFIYFFCSGYSGAEYEAKRNIFSVFFSSFLLLYSTIQSRASKWKYSKDHIFCRCLVVHPLLHVLNFASNLSVEFEIESQSPLRQVSPGVATVHYSKHSSWTL